MTNQGAFTDKAAFESIIHSLLERGDGGSFGKIHLVSISPATEAGAPVEIQPKAVAITEHIIQARLSHGDVCLLLSPGKYMLIFPGLTDVEGSIKATAISREIKARLFGQSAAAINVSVQVLPLSRLKARASAARITAMEEVLDAHERHTAVRLRVVFQPVWDSLGQGVIGNRAVTHREFQGRELFDDAVQFAGEQDPLAIERNACLQHSVILGRKNQGLVFMPQVINDHTVTDLNEFTQSIRQVAAACPDGLVIELTGAVSSLSRRRFRDVIQAVTEGGAEVGVRIFPEPEMARFIRECGASYLCFNEAQAKEAAFTHSALYALFAVVAHEVRGLGFTPCLWNASSGQDVKRAEALGFLLFSGPPIGRNQASMVSPYPLLTDKVFL
ncbi:MAG: hypothetical protein Q7R40_05895 [Phaeospirillum sp.]|nr:hypothetical protein [Phaeospirillum sp.]